MFKMPSKNYNKRPANTMIDTIVIHYTAIDLEKSLSVLRNPKSQVSSHFLIAEDGVVYQLVDCMNRAWHAGVSHWKGRNNVNDFSIGIELVNLGNHPFAEPQILSLIELLRTLRKTYPIKDIVGHSDVAPGRKIDPGPFFPWERITS